MANLTLMAISCLTLVPIIFAFKNITCQEDNECIEIYQCPVFADLLKKSPKPRPVRVIKIIRKNQCGMTYQQIPKVCCPVSTTVTTEPPSVTDILYYKNINLLPYDICGQLPTSTRITYGTKTTQGEFPWMALLIYQTNDGLDFRCGGSIINERYVLTAAHCIIKTLVGVRLGEYNIDTENDCEDGVCEPPVQDFYIEHYNVHPKYNSKTFANDVAVIKLASPADFSVSNVKPICLPIGSIKDTSLVGRMATIAGWGITEDGSKGKKLLKASIPILPNANCRRIYGKFADISENQICAGGHDGKDSCSGDSGGPMKYIDQVDGQPKYIQYGIVSYGPRDCGINGQPAIYTRVSNYMDWILNSIS